VDAVLNHVVANKWKSDFFTVISFTSDASFLGSSVCDVCKLTSLAINMLYCYWSMLGWVITHWASHFGAFGSVPFDFIWCSGVAVFCVCVFGCPLVPPEKKRKKCFFMATINSVHILQKKGNTITRVVYVLEFCQHTSLECAKLNVFVLVELLCWTLVIAECQKLGSARLRWSSAA
jgi:hypothetical protein